MEVALQEKDFVKLMNLSREAHRYIEQRLNLLGHKLSSIPKEIELLDNLSRAPEHKLISLIQALPKGEREVLQPLLDRVIRGVAHEGELKSFGNLLSKVISDTVTSDEKFKGVLERLSKPDTNTRAYPTETVRIVKEVLASSVRLISSESLPPKEVIDNTLKRVKLLIDTLATPERREQVFKELSQYLREPSQENLKRFVMGLSSLLQETKAIPQSQIGPLRGIFESLLRVFEGIKPETAKVIIPNLLEVLEKPTQGEVRLNQAIESHRENPQIRDALLGIR
jgi:hypothetical protein